MQLHFSTREFRDSLGLFATGVAIATASDGETRVGITINSFASVSLEPPLVLFSASRNLNSISVFERAEGFAINVLKQEQAHLSSRFARSGENKWADVAATPGRHGGVLIPSSLASFDCKLYSRCDGGDHIVFIGEVTNILTAGEDAPLIYFSSKYRELASAQATALVA